MDPATILAVIRVGVSVIQTVSGLMNDLHTAAVTNDQAQLDAIRARLDALADAAAAPH